MLIPKNLLTSIRIRKSLKITEIKIEFSMVVVIYILEISAQLFILYAFFI